MTKALTPLERVRNKLVERWGESVSAAGMVATGAWLAILVGLIVLALFGGGRRG